MRHKENRQEDVGSSMVSLRGPRDEGPIGESQQSVDGRKIIFALAYRTSWRGGFRPLECY